MLILSYSLFGQLNYKNIKEPKTLFNKYKTYHQPNLTINMTFGYQYDYWYYYWFFDDLWFYDYWYSDLYWHNYTYYWYNYTYFYYRNQPYYIKYNKPQFPEYRRQRTLTNKVIHSNMNENIRTTRPAQKRNIDNTIIRERPIQKKTEVIHIRPDYSREGYQKYKKAIENKSTYNREGQRTYRPTQRNSNNSTRSRK